MKDVSQEFTILWCSVYDINKCKNENKEGAGNTITTLCKIKMYTMFGKQSHIKKTDSKLFEHFFRVIII